MGDEAPTGIEVELRGGSPGHLETLNSALNRGRRVRIEYQSASRHDLTEREVDPWGLVAALGRWYLVALDHLSGEERMFRLDRMKEVTLLETEAPVPGDFDPARYKGGFKGGEGEPVMTMEISPSVARWFAEYYPLLNRTELDDGWERVELIASSEPWAATLLLQLGRGVRNVEPSELQEAARSLAGSIAANYE